MIDRAPVLEVVTDIHSLDKSQQDSQTVWNLMQGHSTLVANQLGIGTAEQFVVDELALLRRIDHLAESKAATHIVSRGTHQLGVNLHTTVSKIEDEFARSRVLDIGCGEGKLGTELERKAKARVTYLDMDAGMIQPIHTRRGSKIIANAVHLPVRDGQFEKTVGLYAGHIWTPDPVDSLAVLLEQLRVTKEGGAAFAAPLVQGVLRRQDYLASRDLDKLRGRSTTPDQEDSDIAMKVWDIRDYIVINALSTLATQGYIETTWFSFLGEGLTSGAKIESYSSLMDIRRQVDQGVVSDLIADAEELVYSKDVSTAKIIEKVLDLPASPASELAEDHEIWEGGIEGAGFKITRHHLSDSNNTPFIFMSISGRDQAIANLVAKFVRALGDYTTQTKEGELTNVAWVLDPEVEEQLKKRSA